MKKIIVYSTPTCPACIITKDFFKQNNISFEDINVLENHEKAHEMIHKTGMNAVPQIDIDGKMFVGFDRNAIKKELGLV